VSPISILLIAFAMSTDAFAVAISKGASLVRPTLSHALRIGLIFGIIEALTPLLGWALGSIASNAIAEWDHWIAFALLSLLGLHMIKTGLSSHDAHDDDDALSLPIPRLILTAFATSIDAFAVGVSLAFVDVNIVVAAFAIGGATLLMATIGVMLGRVLGNLAGKRAEILGGLILIAVGVAVLIQHLYE